MANTGQSQTPGNNAASGRASPLPQIKVDNDLGLDNLMGGTVWHERSGSWRNVTSVGGTPRSASPASSAGGQKTPPKQDHQIFRSTLHPPSRSGQPQPLPPLIPGNFEHDTRSITVKPTQQKAALAALAEYKGSQKPGASQLGTQGAKPRALVELDAHQALRGGQQGSSKK